MAKGDRAARAWVAVGIHLAFRRCVVGVFQPKGALGVCCGNGTGTVRLILRGMDVVGRAGVSRLVFANEGVI